MAGSKPTLPKPGESKAISLVLPEDLALDLYAFSEAHHDASQTRILCDALREFMRSELEASPRLRQRFKEARDRAIKPPADLIRIASKSKTDEGVA